MGSNDDFIIVYNICRCQRSKMLMIMKEISHNKTEYADVIYLQGSIFMRKKSFIWRHQSKDAQGYYYSLSL
jgi:hypothetical protein